MKTAGGRLPTEAELNKIQDDIPDIFWEELKSAVGSSGVKSLKVLVWKIVMKHHKEIIGLIDEIRPPCNHKGCYNHITHPCEGCGRVQGRITLTELKKEIERLK